VRRRADISRLDAVTSIAFVSFAGFLAESIVGDGSCHVGSSHNKSALHSAFTCFPLYKTTSNTGSLSPWAVFHFALWCSSVQMSPGMPSLVAAGREQSGAEIDPTLRPPRAVWGFRG